MLKPGVVQSVFTLVYILQTQMALVHTLAVKYRQQNSSDSHLLATLFLTGIDLFPV